MSREIISNGLFVSNICEKLKNDEFTDQSIENIIKNSSEVISKCVDPESKQTVRNTGIIIGKIQSGKTANFMSTISVGFDNGFKIAVVLAGNKDDLTNQTYDRIKETFDDLEDNVIIINNKFNKEIFNGDEIANFLDTNTKIIIVMLKNSNNIKAVEEIYENKIISSQPTIIIDDEGDQASLDNNALKPEKEETATSASIESLRKKVLVHSFISVTATPYANLLIEQSKSLSPDWFKLVYPGDDYCGLSKFHGLDSHKYIREIIDKDLNSKEMPVTLIEAINTFFVACAIDKFYLTNNKRRQMLIHTDYIKDKLKKINLHVSDYIKKVRGYISDTSDRMYGDFINTLKKQFEKEYKNTFQNLNFESLEEDLVLSIRRCGSILLTSDNEGSNLKNSSFINTIVVGGNKVERGVTFKRLLITYFTRTPINKSTQDNTEQRARWLGYRIKYLNLCRVYSSSKIIEQFKNIYDSEEDLWNLLLESEGNNFNDVTIYILNNCSTLIPTRKTVAATVTNEIKKTSYIQKRILLDEVAAQYNTDLLNDLKNSVQCIAMNELARKFEMTYNYNLIDFISKIESFKFYENEGFLNYLYNLKTSELLRENEYKIDILWIDNGEDGGLRGVKNDGSVAQLFQGYSNIYIGDRKLGAKYSANKPQIQIHYIKPKSLNINYYSPIMAVLVPNKIKETQNTYVTRAESN